MIILGFTVSILFGLQMYSNFIKMSSYYYLWQQAFPVEIFAVIMFLFWAFHFFSLRKLHEKS